MREERGKEREEGSGSARNAIKGKARARATLGACRRHASSIKRQQTKTAVTGSQRDAASLLFIVKVSRAAGFRVATVSPEAREVIL